MSAEGGPSRGILPPREALSGGTGAMPGGCMLMCLSEVLGAGPLMMAARSTAGRCLHAQPLSCQGCLVKMCEPSLTQSQVP